MSTQQPPEQQQHRPPSTATDEIAHSKEKALSDTEFERLYDGATRIDDPFYRLQSRAAVLLLGRLGLRVSELAHMDESWIDWRAKQICIPWNDPCDIGKGGGVCGSCRQKAKQRVEYADDEADFTLDDALASYFRPKTVNAHRRVNFGHSTRAEMAINDLFDEWTAWPVSVTGVTRRINRAVGQTDVLVEDDTGPHPLRATAATHLAGRGLKALALKQHFGWSQISTAEDYVQDSPEATKRQLEAARTL